MDVRRLRWAHAERGQRQGHRLLVIFALPSPNPESENDPYCVRIDTGSMIAALKKSGMKDAIVSMMEGKP